ncbi:MAG: transglutaminase domain-containing protein [Candidatus Dormibacteraeota bacterium]|uniref:Transglutaminase domain-containing protein n=1 Tax=Candidatus Amunia macphersoniae TaxID=3127014 RepID=A0A934NAL8_9BACT|nr:transglutaminase domain-containing protein [Candidatus Dormibacteraeota bacterium]
MATLTGGGVRPLTARSSTATALVMALLTATGWALLSGGWQESSASALLVGLAGVIEAVILARGRVSRSVALLIAPVLLFASVLPASIGTRPETGPGGIPHLIGQYATAAATGLLGNAQWEFQVSLSALLWVVGAWTAWFAVRERRGALASGPCWAVLAVTVINAPTADQVGLPAAVAAVLAILLIAAVYLDGLNDSWQDRRVGVLPGTDGRFAGAAAGAGVLVVVIALLMPPLTSTDISGRLFAVGGNHGGKGSGISPGGSGLGPPGTVRFSPSTIPGGPLTLANTPVLNYTSSISTGLYLRMATDGVFDGGNWLPDESALNNGDFSQQVTGPGRIPRDRSVADGGVGALQQPVSVTVTLSKDTSGDNTLPFPGEPDASTVAARVNGLQQPIVGGALLTVDSATAVQPIAGSSFTTTATQPAASADQLRAASRNYPSFIDRDQFTTLADDPTHGGAVITALARQWTRNTSNPYDAATAIEAQLRDPRLFNYTLDPPQPPSSPSVWPVTYFLTTSHRGYCQYFATAMGAMLRALGIPARLVNGYGPGTSPNSAARGVDQEAIYQVGSNDAHTWVEAYFPGYGWIPFEPTPPSNAGDYKPFSRGSVSAPAGPAPTRAPSVSPAPSVPAPGHSPPPSTSNGSSVPMVVRTAAAALALLLVPLMVFSAWFLRPRGLRGVWRRVGLVGSLAGVPRSPALTFDEYASRLSAALPRERAGTGPGRSRGADWRSALADIAAGSDRALYGRGGPAPGESARIVAAWRRLARVAPHVGWRLLRRHTISR